MFRFFTGMVVGFLAVWLFAGSQSAAELRETARRVGRSAQRGMQETMGEMRRETTL